MPTRKDDTEAKIPPTPCVNRCGGYIAEPTEENGWSRAGPACKECQRNWGRSGKDMRGRRKPAVNEDDHEEYVRLRDRGPRRRLGTFPAVPGDLGTVPDHRPNQTPDDPSNPIVDGYRKTTGQPAIIRKPHVDILRGISRSGWCPEMEAHPAHSKDCPVCGGEDLVAEAATYCPPSKSPQAKPEPKPLIYCVGCGGASIGESQKDGRRRERNYAYLSRGAIEGGKRIMARVKDLNCELGKMNPKNKLFASKIADRADHLGLLEGLRSLSSYGRKWNRTEQPPEETVQDGDEERSGREARPVVSNPDSGPLARRNPQGGRRAPGRTPCVASGVQPQDRLQGAPGMRATL